jgi:hypothetical protein
MEYPSAEAHAAAALPYLQIRATHTANTITIYQAYSAPLAAAAVAAGTLAVPGFKRARMTWIKPSFLWMMYRAGWSTKDANQACILAIELSRTGFDAALRMAVLSHFDPAVHAGTTKADWDAANKSAQHPVVVQWDPERDVHARALPWRSIQVGLRGAAVDAYVDEWIVSVRDVTDECARIKALVDAGREAEAYAAMPREDVYALDAELMRSIGASM